MGSPAVLSFSFLKYGRDSAEAGLTALFSLQINAEGCSHWARHAGMGVCRWAQHALVPQRGPHFDTVSGRIMIIEF